jgi:hypothetical protein
MKEVAVIRKNILTALLVHFTAWVIIICSFTFEPLHWFLLPIVNNIPAFITVSKWFLQSLIVIYLLIYSVCILRHSLKQFRLERNVVYVHVVFTMIHLAVVSTLIILYAGFEDL